MNGRLMAVMARETIAMATLPTEKLRSRNSPRGTSGSRRTRACQATNRPSTTTPSAMSRGTLIGPVMVPQSYRSPSWMPNTSRNMPAALSATPSQSMVWACVSSTGTRRTARTKPIRPTGMLTKKIHSQPAASTSTPPRIGPTSVATPAVAPQRAMALPRLAAGKVRVMTAMVCGVRRDAPTPWTTRAAMSPPIESVRPHHSEARVKIVRPSR